MKRFVSILLALLLVISLVACSKNDIKNNQNQSKSNISANTSKLGTDFQKSMNQSNSERITAICETEDGYYFEYDVYVYYMDKATGNTTILCGKPECAHDSNTCNAYIYSPFLTYYNGKLYYSNNDYVNENGSYVNKGNRLYCMNLDGTNHSVVQELEFTPGGNTSDFITAPIIHQGNVYFVYSSVLYIVPLGADISKAISIYGKEKSDDRSNIFNSNELHYTLWADGDNTYFMANIKQSNNTYKETLFCYDEESAEVKEIWKTPNKSEVGNWDTTGVSVSQWYVTGGYIYFYLSGNDLWCTELSSGKTSKLADVKDNANTGIAAFSDKHIVIMSKSIYGEDLLNGGSAYSGGDSLYIYNYSGKLEKEISLKDIYKENKAVADCSLLYIGNDKVYILADATDNSDYNATHTTLVYSIYEADIQSGTIKSTDWSVGQ